MPAGSAATGCIGGAGKAGGCGSNQSRCEKILHVHSLKIRPLGGTPCFTPIRYRDKPKHFRDFSEAG
jgi:hypothetical protein